MSAYLTFPFVVHLNDKYTVYCSNLVQAELRTCLDISGPFPSLHNFQ